MQSGPGIVSTINNETVSLVFNEEILLDQTTGMLTVAFPPNEINGWTFHFVFTDNLEIWDTPLTSRTSFENDGNTIVFTYLSWYGHGVATNTPHYIESVSRKTRIYIIMRTTAVIHHNSRKVHINIWQALK